MNRTEELAKLAQLEKEVAELRAMLEKPEVAGSLLNKPSDGNAYWMLERDSFGGLKTYRNIVEPKFSYGGNCFQSESISQAYAEAIDTMLLLRHQPGTDGENRQWTIMPVNEECEKLTIEMSNNYRVMVMLSVPMFITEETAQSAISTIGSDRILSMFKTFHGIYE